jgi:hypothetical protein
VGGRSAAAQVVIVHRGQVVVRERIAVHELERGARHQGAFARRVEQGRGLHHEEWPQPLAAAEAHMAHRVDQPLRAGPLLGQHFQREQVLEQALDVGRNRIEALAERRPGIRYVIHIASPK